MPLFLPLSLSAVTFKMCLLTHPGVEAALSPVELVLLGAGLADAPRVHLGRLGLDVGVVEAAEHYAEVQHGEPSEERIKV